MFSAAVFASAATQPRASASAPGLLRRSLCRAGQQAGPGARNDGGRCGLVGIALIRPLLTQGPPSPASGRRRAVVYRHGVPPRRDGAASLPRRPQRNGVEARHDAGGVRRIGWSGPANSFAVEPIDHLGASVLSGSRGSRTRRSRASSAGFILDACEPESEPRPSDEWGFTRRSALLLPWQWEKVASRSEVG